MWQQYRDELVTMGLVFMVSSAGLFFVTSRFVAESEDSPTLTPTPTAGTVLGQIQEPTTTLAPTIKLGLITPTEGAASVSASPTPAQVPYGSEGSYAYEKYQIEFIDPRLLFEDGAEKRRFVVDVVIKNIAVAEGLQNSLSASIIKDGNVIVPQAPLSASESKLILPGQQLSFSARLSLIEGTDVASLSYKPVGIEAVIHELQ